MASPSYVGNTSFRVVDEEPNENTNGVDTLGVVLRGPIGDLTATADAWTRGRVATSLGYPNMYLQNKRTRKGRSAFAEIILEFAGYLSATLANPISINDSITLQAGTFASDELDSKGNDQNIQAQFNAQTTTTRWIYRGASSPPSPRYQALVPSSVPTNTLFGHYPAKYTGTLQTKMVGRADVFDRERLAPGVWGVTETWSLRIENDG